MRWPGLWASPACSSAAGFAPKRPLAIPPGSTPARCAMGVHSPGGRSAHGRVPGGSTGDPTQRASAPPAARAVIQDEPVARSEDSGHRVVEEWMGEEVETLQDLLGPGLRGVVVGINPSPRQRRRRPLLPGARRPDPLPQALRGGDSVGRQRLRGRPRVCRGARLHRCREAPDAARCGRQG